MLHQSKEWLFEKYFKRKMTQTQIAEKFGIKQVTVSKWLNIHFTKTELKEQWNYGGKREDLSGDNHWTKKYPNHWFNSVLKKGIRLGSKQSDSEKKKKKRAKRLLKKAYR